MKRYLIAKRWWGMTRARWRARMWAFLLGPHIDAPPSDCRRTLRFGTRGVFVALAVAGACHLASGLVLRTILGAWTAGEARAKRVRTVTVHLLPASALDLPPSLAARPPDAPAPPVRVPQRETIPAAEDPPPSEGRITPKPQPVAAAPATEDTVVTSADGVVDANGGGRGTGTDGGSQGPASGLGTDVFVAFDTPPQRLSEIEPDYPELAIEARSEGTVFVQVTIDETGKVIEAVVVKSDVISALEQAALKAAKATPFRPAKQRDVPVTSRVVLPFRFRLKTEAGS